MAKILRLGHTKKTVFSHAVSQGTSWCLSS